ncbi:ATP-binding protein [Streptomyces noursei]|uniref:ATP-binding protein n=1 Tax=Streptomyces noursei TaxID=1971 RepID=UPI0008346D2E
MWIRCAADADEPLSPTGSRLVARTRLTDPEHIAEWDLPSHPSAVADARAEVTRQLTGWGLDEQAFTTELILSELITNAIRYAPGPIKVRLLYDRTLTCEVTDTSSTSPLHRPRQGHLGRAGRDLRVRDLTEAGQRPCTPAGPPRGCPAPPPATAPARRGPGGFPAAGP